MSESNRNAFYAYRAIPVLCTINSIQHTVRNRTICFFLLRVGLTILMHTGCDVGEKLGTFFSSRFVPDHMPYHVCDAAPRILYCTASIVPYPVYFTVPRLFYRTTYLLPYTVFFHVPRIFYRTTSIMPYHVHCTIPSLLHHTMSIIPYHVHSTVRSLIFPPLFVWSDVGVEIPSRLWPIPYLTVPHHTTPPATYRNSTAVRSRICFLLFSLVPSVRLHGDVEEKPSRLMPVPYHAVPYYTIAYHMPRTVLFIKHTVRAFCFLYSGWRREGTTKACSAPTASYRTLSYGTFFTWHIPYHIFNTPFDSVPYVFVCPFVSQGGVGKKPKCLLRCETSGAPCWPSRTGNVRQRQSGLSRFLPSQQCGTSRHSKPFFVFSISVLNRLFIFGKFVDDVTSRHFPALDTILKFRCFQHCTVSFFLEKCCACRHSTLLIL